MTLKSRRAKRMIRRLSCLVPRLSVAERIARMYLDNIRGVNNADMCINGESLLSRRLAPWIEDPVLDIGSNTGSWVQMALDAGLKAKVHCFEPAPDSYEVLASRAWPTWVTLHRLAMGAAPGEVKLHLTGSCSELNSVYSRDDIPSPACATVPMETIDCFAAAHGIARIGWVKIDVEGHDLPAMEGGRGMLARGEIDYLQFEYGHGWIVARRYLRDAFDLVAECPYVVYRLSPWGLIRFDAYSVDMEDYRHCNYLLVRRGVGLPEGTRVLSPTGRW